MGDEDKLNRQLIKLDSVRDRVSSMPLHIDDKPSTIPEIWSWWRRAVSAGAALGVLDYLQLIRPTAEQARMGPAEFIGEVNRNLVAMVKETRTVPLIIVSSETNGSLRWSGDIEYGLGGWLSMKRSEDNDKRIDVTMKKQRFGSVATSPIPMYWDHDELIDEDTKLDREAMR